MNELALEPWLAAKRAEIDRVLDARLPQPQDDPNRLIEAMRYSLLAPGKRLRPILALAAAEAVGATVDEPVRIAAAAVELVHCYSLIHDDLPAMDDDDFRRGRPTNHKAFGEATAILAGDGLLTLAFDWMAQAGELTNRPARDMLPEPPQTLEGIERMHMEKTGALFRAALEVGAAVAGAKPAHLHALAAFGTAYGIAFQHADDRDDDEHKAFAAVAERRIHELVTEAIAALGELGEAAAPLCALARRLDTGAAKRE